LANDKGTHLAQELAKQQTIEDLRVSFADAASDFVRSARDAVESASDHHFGYTLEDVTNHKSELDASDAQINEKADSLKGKADGFAKDLSSKGVTDNRHTTLTSADVEGQRAKVSEALQKRREAYEAELARQSANEAKRKDYAAKANSFINHVDEKRKELSSLSGSPEERMSATEALYQGGAASKAQVDELASIDTEMKSLGIYDNKHTPYSLPVVQTRKNQYDTSVNNFLSGLKEEKELNDRAAQLQAEYERSLKLENLKIEYGQAAGQLHLWLENANETVKDPISCATVPDAQDIIHTFEALIAEKPTQESKLGSLNSLASELTSSFGVNSFQPYSPSDIQGRWNAFLSDVDARKQALDAELAKQQHNENLRIQFAEKAKALSLS
jgi:actinin alpha